MQPRIIQRTHLLKEGLTMLQLTTSNFKSTIGNGVTVVDFWAEWCGPCRALAPAFETVSGELKTITFAKLNVDEERELAQDHGVMSIPCLIVFKNGTEVDRLVGNMSKEMLKQKLVKWN
ncbi:MAG: thioredoxin [Candidatus Woesearchaeota archaeon]|nr:thioredoxin [Candidatus Woesearchaeota archaeon]